MKKLLATITAAMLLSSCASGESSGGAAETGSTEQSSATATQPSIDISDEDDESRAEMSVYTVLEDSSSGCEKTLNILVAYDFSVPDRAFLEKLNKKLRDDGYDFSVKMTILNAFLESPIDHYQKCLENGTGVDILMSGAGISEDVVNSDPDVYKAKPHDDTYTECVDKGYYISLDSFFETELGRQLKSVFNENYWLRNTCPDGKIYGLYTGYNSNSPLALNVQNDVLDELGISIDDLGEGLEALDPVLEKLKNAGGKAPLAYGDSIVKLCEYLGFSQQLGGIYINEKTGRADNLFADRSFAELARLMYDWKAKGYIRSDQDDSAPMMLTNAYPLLSEDRKQIIITDAFVSNDQSNCAVGVTSSSKYPEEACALLALLFSDPEYASLVCCGSDYTTEGGRIVLPDSSRSFLAHGNPLLIPANPYIIPPVTTPYTQEPRGKLEMLNDQLSRSKRSAAYNIRIEDKELKDKIKAVNDIYEKYCGLFSGDYADIESTIKEANALLKEAGIDEVLERINGYIVEVQE